MLERGVGVVAGERLITEALEPRAVSESAVHPLLRGAHNSESSRSNY